MAKISLEQVRKLAELAHLSLTDEECEGFTHDLERILEHAESLQAVMGGDVMMGHDPDCARWIRRFREAAAPGTAVAGTAVAGAAPRGRREGGHRRRPVTPA